MEIPSDVTTSLDQWVENGFINIQQREAIAQIMGAVDYTVEDLLHSAYEDGFDEGYSRAEYDLTDKLRDTWFEQGWEEALIEHGIEE